ncbi:ribonuclease P protein subunit [Candidatus Woesearchaeota archaeon]|nr:ribonuclease P protein subunit [Candidatus Woesearchaeota archaeon]MBW3017418.1 ribonuclease P protein subunit [Candidatus Woesearchaeota archaeon]
MKSSEMVKHEFIGLTIRITKALNKALEGVEGKVIDETKNTFVLLTEKGRKVILKNQLAELVVKDNNSVVVAGLVRGKHEERIKVK